MRRVILRSLLGLSLAVAVLMRGLRVGGMYWYFGAQLTQQPHPHRVGERPQLVRRRGDRGEIHGGTLRPQTDLCKHLPTKISEQENIGRQKVR